MTALEALARKGSTEPPSTPAPRAAGDALERASAYVAKMDPAISGQGGHDATWRVARKCAQDFGLGYEDTLAILHEYNARCAPPWSERELKHKAKDATTKARVSNPVGDRERHWTMPREHYAPRPNGEPETPPGRFDDDEPQGEAPEPLPFLWVRDFGEFQKPAPLKWLLRDVRTGKPFLRAGKCAVLGGDGGVGKGFFWLTLAVCVALGRDLFDTFRPEQAGRVAILAGEDDQQEIHHRLFRIANAFGLDREEIALVQERVGIFPLSGQQVSLLALDQARAPFRTAKFETLVGQLGELAGAGGFEWSFVGLDPLARFGAANVETDQGTATAFVQALEHMAAQLPGEPSIGVTHHSSAASVSQGRANLRGVTGLRNAFRLAMLLDAFETPSGLRGVLLRNDKNNLAPTARPLWLVRMENEPMGDGRWLETAGVLRRATDDEARELETVAGSRSSASPDEREQAKRAKVRNGFEAEQAAVLELLPVAPDHTTATAVLVGLKARGIRMSDRTLRGILEQSDGVLDLSNGAQSKPRQWTRRAGSS